VHAVSAMVSMSHAIHEKYVFAPRGMPFSPVMMTRWSESRPPRVT